MIKVSTTGMVVSLKTDLRFPIPGQQGHGGRIIHFFLGTSVTYMLQEAPILKIPENPYMVFYGFSRIQGRHGWFTGYVLRDKLLSSSVP